MVGAALLAKKAVELGRSRKPWVKTTLAPGSKVVMAYYERAGLLPYLDKLGFNLVGYGCTTCIGNSGPLPPAISEGGDGNDPGGAAAGARDRCRGGGGGARSAPTPGASRSTSRISGRRRKRSPTWCSTRWPRRCSPATTPTCSKAMTTGAGWTSRRAI